MRALEGLKVIDFGWVVVAPFLTQYLSQHGATVVKVETQKHPDMLRLALPYKAGLPGVNRSHLFSIYNAGKYSLSLDLRNAAAKRVLERLIGWADVVVENFAAGVMARLGLGYDELVKIKPDLIMVMTSMQGETGPHAHQPGVGTSMAVLPGFGYITGWPDRDPLNPYGAYTDFPAPRLAASALLAALEYRRRTGKGQCLDVSQFESGVQFLAPEMLDYAVNGRVATRLGNRSPFAAPHGVYRCLGEDRWCAIAVSTEDEWLSLTRVMNQPELACDPMFANQAARRQNEDVLDGLVEEWTVAMTAEEVMAQLQAAGVPAATVHTAEALANDPQICHRGHFVPVDHPEMGVANAHAASFRLSKTPAEIRPVPCLGEHAEFVCTELLGMATEEFVDLFSQGVFE